jgi:hypothetical protein
MSAAQAKNFSSRTLAHWLALAFFVLALVAPMSLAALPTGPASASANSAISANNLLNMGANGISGLFDQGAAPFGMVSQIPYAAWSDNLIVANDSAHNVEMGLNNAGLTGLSLGTSAIPGMVGYVDNAGNLVDAGTVAAESTTPLEQLQGAASRAAQNVGDGNGPVYGTQVHSAFKAEVGSLGNANLGREVSYLNGEVVPYGTPGSVRLDVVEYDAGGNIKAVYDLETGSTSLTPARIQRIRSQLPGGGAGVSFHEVRP